mgnify:CR=1 FL=1
MSTFGCGQVVVTSCKRAAAAATTASAAAAPAATVGVGTTAARFAARTGLYRFVAPIVAMASTTAVAAAAASLAAGASAPLQAAAAAASAAPARAPAAPATIVHNEDAGTFIIELPDSPPASLKYQCVLAAAMGLFALNSCHPPYRYW